MNLILKKIQKNLKTKSLNLTYTTKNFQNIFLYVTVFQYINSNYFWKMTLNVDGFWHIILQTHDHQRWYIGNHH